MVSSPGAEHYLTDDELVKVGVLDKPEWEGCQDLIIIGTGPMALNWVRSIRREILAGKFRILAIVDLNLGNQKTFLKTIQNEYGVDTRLATENRACNIRTVAQMLGGQFKNAVIGIVTPAVAHLQCIKDAIEAGANPNKILIEKPIVTNATELAELMEVLKGESIAVQEQWFNAASLRLGIRILEDPKSFSKIFGIPMDVEGLELDQSAEYQMQGFNNKDRSKQSAKRRNFSGPKNSHAALFDMPHILSWFYMISQGLKLGHKFQVTDARSRDMVLPAEEVKKEHRSLMTVFRKWYGYLIPNHGRSDMVLENKNISAYAESDLEDPKRRRSLDLFINAGKLTINFDPGTSKTRSGQDRIEATIAFCRKNITTEGYEDTPTGRILRFRDNSVEQTIINVGNSIARKSKLRSTEKNNTPIMENLVTAMTSPKKLPARFFTKLRKR